MTGFFKDWSRIFTIFFTRKRWKNLFFGKCVVHICDAKVHMSHVRQTWDMCDILRNLNSRCTQRPQKWGGSWNPPYPNFQLLSQLQIFSIPPIPPPYPNFFLNSSKNVYTFVLLPNKCLQTTFSCPVYFTSTSVTYFDMIWEPRESLQLTEGSEGTEGQWRAVKGPPIRMRISPILGIGSWYIYENLHVAYVGQCKHPCQISFNSSHQKYFSWFKVFVFS